MAHMWVSHVIHVQIKLAHEIICPLQVKKRKEKLKQIIENVVRAQNRISMHVRAYSKATYCITLQYTAAHHHACAWRFHEVHTCVCVKRKFVKDDLVLFEREVLQCVAVCCSVLQCVAVSCSVLQYVAVC